MKAIIKTILILSVPLSILISCHTSRKNSAPAQTDVTQAPGAAPVSTVTVATVPTSTPAVRNGIIPGELELQAIRVNFPDVTAETLSKGHEIYIGKCTDCHRKKNIFAYNETRWKEIIDDMAPRSHLTPKETDDLHKYVLSMKATQNSYAK